MSVSSEVKLVDLPALAAGSSGPARDYLIEIAASPPLGRAALAALLGTARVLSLLYADAGATDDADRLGIIVDPQLPRRIATCLKAPHVARPLFSGEVLGLPPFWLAAAVVIVEHRPIAHAPVLPQAIGGYRLGDVVDGAHHLAAVTPPFDRAEPTLAHLMEVLRHA